ncbi:TrkH family potassium uptake protein [Shimia biformata]|uniref:TrkH family potassium uptake protein n=1 Tax=Shimia biformata TaxID=1294299 RepID=UPI00194F5333|nr:TrkH family potassium uptake protein [Shimia biformata]
MLARIGKLPLFLLMLGASGLMMFVPAGLAYSGADFHVGRSFLYSGTLLIAVFFLIAIALGDQHEMQTPLQHLRALFLSFTLLPVFLAVPFAEGLQTTTFFNAYFEMVSSLTTTGATVFGDPERLSPALHLWRGLVGWCGGLIMWIAAAAVFAPLSLGGYEVTTQGEPGQADTMRGQMQVADPMKRWQRTAAALIPIYAGLTLALWVMLLVLGDRPLVACMHAMAVMSTSGISPIGGLPEAGSGIPGEIVIFLFLFFALSRLTFSTDKGGAVGGFGQRRLFSDPEFRLGLIIVVLAPTLLFLRHWVGAYEVDEVRDVSAALLALWGSVFTVMSFLTTTGFESHEWHVATDWSGLHTTGIILMGLAIVGGGVATTAGGVKLLRVYVLYLQGYGEMQKLVHPSIVVASRKERQRIRRKGAVIAWVFFMLFAISLAVIVATLSGFGVDFEHAMLLAVSSLTTTGPLSQIADETPVLISTYSTSVKSVLCAAMVLGRMETLAIIALMSPELWQK